MRPTVQTGVSGCLTQSIARGCAQVTKGAPHIILKLTHDERIHHMVDETVAAFGQRGIRCLAIARTLGGELRGLLREAVHRRSCAGCGWEASHQTPILGVCLGRSSSSRVFAPRPAAEPACYRPSHR